MMHLNIEDLTFFRGRSSIDLEAIFGGHISGRRLRGVKINPIFHDPETHYSPFNNPATAAHASSQRTSEADIHIDVYESLPRPSSNSHQRLKRQVQSDPGLVDIDSSEELFLPHRTWYSRRSRLSSASENLELEMKDNQREVELENSDSSAGKVDHVSEGSLCNSESGREVPDFQEKGASTDSANNNVPSEKPVLDLDVSVGEKNHLSKIEDTCVPDTAITDEENSTSSVESNNSHKDNENSEVFDDSEAVPSTTNSPNRRLSDSSMIVYDDVDQETFPNLSSVVSHMSSLDVPEIQENVLLYTSDGDSPTNDLMSIPSETPQAGWNNMGMLTVPPEVEEFEGEANASVAVSPLPPPDSKPLRPILLSTCSNDESSAFPKSPNLSPSDHKTVTFAKDTVFNEGKPNRYQKEKINLKELYHERVCGRSGMGMVNPVFVISDEKLGTDSSDCLTDDEKAKRHSFRINLVSTRPGMDNASMSSEGSSPSPRVLDLNTPAYLQKYLEQTLEARETNSPEESTANPPATEDTEGVDIHTSTDIIIELPEDTYARHERIRREASRKKTIIRWVVCLVVVLLLIGGAVALGVYMSKKSGSTNVNTTTAGIMQV